MMLDFNPNRVGPSTDSDRQKADRKNRHLKAGTRRKRLDFDGINKAALNVLPQLAAHWSPEGHRKGDEYVAKNPTRNDRRAGSFKINLRTGRWADFATGDRGGDPISLAAYLFGLKQCEAAFRLADFLGVDPHASA